MSMDERLLPEPAAAVPPPQDQPPPKQRTLLRNLAFALPFAFANTVDSLNTDAVQLTFTPVLEAAIVARAELLSGVLATFLVLLLGHNADELRTAWGRRRPLVLGGGLTFCAASYLLVYPLVQHVPTPGETSLNPDAEALLGNYLLALIVVKEIANDVLTISLGSWAVELTSEAKERASLFAS